MSGRLTLILSVGVLVRFLYVFSVDPFLHWDEAPQAYMAQQIAAGHLHPLVHFQLPYIGAVEQYPLALLMVILGDSVSTINLFYLALSLLSLTGACLLYRNLFSQDWDYLALAFFAFCPPVLIYFSLQGWSFASLLLFEVVILWLLLSPRAKFGSKIYLSLLGFLSGLAMYNNALIVGILGFVSWYVYCSSSRRNLFFFFVWFIVGYLPMLYFNLTNGFLSYRFLVAKFLGISQEMVITYGPFRALIQGIINKVSGRGPESDFNIFLSFPEFGTIEEYYLQFIAFTVSFGIITVSFLTIFPRFQDKPGIQVLPLFPKAYRLLFVTILFSCVASISTVRYMIVLVPLVPILLCQGLAVCRNYSRKLMMVCVLVMASYLLVGHLKVLTRENSDPCQQVLQVLEKHHLVTGYGSYPFQSYAAFLSKGRIKISPQIGPMYIDKIPSFSQAVDQADDVFYILPEGFSLEYLDKNNISYQAEGVDGWVVIWNLSKRVFPKELLSPEELARDDGYMRWSYRENPLVLNAYRGGH